MKLGTEELSNMPHVEFHNAEKLKGLNVSGISTDTRSIREGDLFFALRGDRFDGHRFLAEAFAKGAVAAVIEPAANIDSVKTMPLVVVSNTTRALGDLTRYYRRKFEIPVIAIGGSNGKTTTKEMIAAVLRAKYNVLSTEGNLNNHIGVPLTLSKLEKKHHVAVIEIGTNHPGEIKYLCSIVEPTHGLITSIGREHLESFKNLSGVAKEEGALFEYLARQKGSVVFVNADDQNIAAKAKVVKNRVTYSFATGKVSVAGDLVKMTETCCARMSFSPRRARRNVHVQLSVPGEHNAMNALSAATVGITFKVPAPKIKAALEKFRPVGKRMEILRINGVTVYNDTYNANSDSMVAALKTFASSKTAGKKVAVLADMKELGDAAASEHANVGREISGMSIDYLLTHGENAKRIHDEAAVPFKIHYEQKNVLAEYLVELLSPGDAVLVKGSRGMKMEDVIIFLQERLKAD